MKRVLAVLALGLALAPGAASRAVTSSVPPLGLRAFVLRANEPAQADHTYAEMPAFVWNPVAHATSYQLQLADNRTFSDVSILYQDSKLSVPVASIQQQLPWMNGDPYALWVHVRAIVGGKPSLWSKPFGFNMGWQNVPEQMSAPTGLDRWTPVE